MSPPNKTLALELADDRPPKSNELELTVFGPGVGECLVLHLGSNEWAVIDSCRDPVSGEPAALRYLKHLGVDPSQSVQLILATHWHDDHIQGISAVLDECTRAEFAMSAALQLSQFIPLVLEVDATNRMVSTDSSAREFRAVLEILANRRNQAHAFGPDVFAQDSQQLFVGGHREAVRIWALSPSGATISNSHANLARQLLAEGNTRRFKRFSPNDLSVAVHVESPHHHLLLGADLENTHGSQFGWKAVLSSPRRPHGQSSVFKVPHHGSENAHHDDVWGHMLSEKPLAVVTPFAKGVKALPSPADLRRISQFAFQAYCTSWPATSKPTRRQGADGLINSIARHRRAITQRPGYVRLRIDFDDPSAVPTVELFGSAKRIEPEGV